MNLDFSAKGKNNKIAKGSHVKKLIEFYETIESDAVKKNAFLTNVFVQLIKQETSSETVGTVGLVSGMSNRETWSFKTEQRVDDQVFRDL